MKTTIEQKEPCLINIHIELPPEHFEKEWKRIGDKYQKFADIPGFRKGKAPRASIEKKYAQEMKIEVIEHLTEDSIKRALEEHQVKILLAPEVQKSALRSDRSFYLLVTVMIRPEINLKTSDYSELEVIVEERTYDIEKIVQSYLETMQKKWPEHTLENLRQETHQSLKNSFENRAELEAKKIIQEKVIDNIPCEPPSPLVEKIKRSTIDDFIKKCKYEELSSEEIKSALEHFEPVAEEAAIRQLQWMFIAQAIAKKEAFKLTDEEFYDYLDGVAEERDVALAELLQELKRNGELSLFHDKAMEEKVLEFIYSKTKIIKVPAALPKKKKLTAMETMKRKAKKGKKIV